MFVYDKNKDRPFCIGSIGNRSEEPFRKKHKVWQQASVILTNPFHVRVSCPVRFLHQSVSCWTVEEGPTCPGTIVAVTPDVPLTRKRATLSVRNAKKVRQIFSGQTSNVQHKVEDKRIVKHSTTQHCKVQSSTAPHRTAPHRTTAQHSTVQYSTVQYSIAQHSTAQHSTVQHSTAQHSTAQHSTAQYSTVQHSTVQHSTAPHCIAQCLKANFTNNYHLPNMIIEST